jgi:hypothetical protein
MTATRFNRVGMVLRERGADHIEHPGGNLFDHVGRVARLLRAWGADDDMQLTGLSHACYGTDGFSSSLLDLGERPFLAEIIGERAEEWVYLYASCDRQVVYPNLKDPGPLLFKDRHTGRSFEVAEPDAHVFVELTAANELDLVMTNPRLASQWGPPLFDLLAGAKGRLSEPAWSCCSETLRTPATSPTSVHRPMTI